MPQEFSSSCQLHVIQVIFMNISSPIYWSPFLYRMTMRLLYGTTYKNRYEIVSNEIAPYTSVVEFCCGCGYLYENFLLKKRIQYTGIDLLPKMLTRLRKLGVKTITGNILTIDCQQSDYCLMVGSLYHFHPNESLILEKMAKCGAVCIVLEPIINLSTSRNYILRFLGIALSYIKNTSSSHRIQSDTLDSIILSSAVEVLSDSLVLDGKYRLIKFKKSSYE